MPTRWPLGKNILGQRRSEEHTSELQSRSDLVCRLLLEKKKTRFTGARLIGKSFTAANLSTVDFSHAHLDYVSFLSAYMVSFFFFNDTATTEIYTLSLHDALPISRRLGAGLELGNGECAQVFRTRR